MSLMASFCAAPLSTRCLGDVLDEVSDLIESASECVPTYSLVGVVGWCEGAGSTFSAGSSYLFG